MLHGENRSEPRSAPTTTLDGDVVGEHGTSPIRYLPTAVAAAFIQVPTFACPSGHHSSSRRFSRSEPRALCPSPAVPSAAGRSGFAEMPSNSRYRWKRRTAAEGALVGSTAIPLARCGPRGYALPPPGWRTPCSSQSSSCGSNAEFLNRSAPCRVRPPTRKQPWMTDGGTALHLKPTAFASSTVAAGA